ncbi:MAG: histidine kinase [Candidatus Eisenbacteria bacterium]|uniref:Histidine kinase n=1 Tax=Eiseniibacteriota bacterium TaxID=2212470 RepID=A0A849SQD8_UNCEI|nr:histidine kinase [Candidatus Eisenbacteria bacterium]
MIATPPVPEARPAARRHRILLAAALWAAFGLFFTLQSYSVRTAAGRPFSAVEVTLVDLLYVSLWGAFTPLVLWLSRRLRVERPHVARRIMMLVACGIGVAVLQRFLFDMIVHTIRASPQTPFSWVLLARSVLASFDYGLTLFGIVVLIEHATSLQQRIHAEAVRATRLEAALSTARLDALERQLQPHFLFNTLNAISSLVTEDPRRAQALIGRLGELLRATLAQPQAHEISVRHEVEWLEQYLAIESARVGERLRISIEIEPAAYAAQVPRLLLQPLVENALKHGVAARPGRALLAIEAHRLEEWLELRVRDEPDSNGAAPHATALESGAESKPGTAGLGIGLANTRSRLHTLYGDAHRLELNALPSGGTETRVRIPYRVASAPVAAREAAS